MDCRGFLQGLNELLASDGRYIFLENAYGGKIFGLSRCLRYRQWHLPGIEYFTRFHLQLISQILAIEEVKRSYLPPIYLIVGRKRYPASPPAQ